MTLALFDLDNTLLGGDSDYAWGQFIVTKGMVDKETYRAANHQYYLDYQRGELDAVAYQRFCMAPLAGRSVADMAVLHKEFMASHIRAIWLPKAVELIEHHRQQGHRLIIITATNRFVVGPIAAAFAIDDLICSETGVVEGVFNGELVDEPCMGAGKVSKLKRWMKEQGESLEDAYFYSDSHNDLPLLNIAPNAIAVDPDQRLSSAATEHGWPIISLR